MGAPASPSRTGLGASVGDLRRCYRNWIGLAIALTLRSGAPRRAVLRDGGVLGRPPGRGRIFALADAVRRGWTVRGSDGGAVVLTPSSGIELECRWEQGYDVENAIEVFADHVYDSPVQGRWVIDGGAGTGDASLYFAREGATEVVAFEPFPGSAELFRRNVARSPFADLIHLHESALGGSHGARSLQFPRQVPSAASLAPADDARNRWAFGEGVEVPVETLAEAIPADVQGPGVLKLDCQGAEYEILGAAPDRVLARFDAIVVEFTNGADPLRRRLESVGFEVNADPATRGYLRARRAPATGPPSWASFSGAR